MLNRRDLLILVLTRFRRGSRPKSKGLLLIDSARLSLAPGVAVEDAGLRDLHTGARVKLNDLGQRIASQLKAGTTQGALLQAIGQTYEIGQDQVRHDVLAFITVLHAQQLLSIRQSYLAEGAARLWARRRGRSPYRRYPATPLNILAGSLLAQVPIAVAALILAVAIQPLVFLPLLRQGSLPSRAMALQATLPLITYGAILAGSITLHELIHFWTARRLGVPLKSVYVGPGRIGITQLQAGSPKNEIVSAAGPAGTALILLTLAAVLPMLHLGYPLAGVAASMLCVAVAVVHLFGLTPWTSDGKQFWRLIRLD
jgi:Coenzyme PQQ synthesis protein D (PqqD)